VAARTTPPASAAERSIAAKRRDDLNALVREPKRKGFKRTALLAKSSKKRAVKDRLRRLLSFDLVRRWGYGGSGPNHV
jgi:hypothetical protein